MMKRGDIAYLTIRRLRPLKEEFVFSNFKKVFLKKSHVTRRTPAKSMPKLVRTIGELFIRASFPKENSLDRAGKVSIREKIDVKHN